LLNLSAPDSISWVLNTLILRFYHVEVHIPFCMEKQQQKKSINCIVLFISFTFWKVNVSQFFLKSKCITMNMLLRGFRSTILYCDVILVAEKFLFICILQVNSIFLIIFILLMWLMVFADLTLNTFNTIYYKQWSEISIHLSVVVK
jgi:hypothetical protein